MSLPSQRLEEVFVYAVEGRHPLLDADSLVDHQLGQAAGSGNAAIPAAEAGATVVASDLTPQLLEFGRRQAEQRGVELEWREADAESLPFADDEFDVVMSCVGVMFAPHHEASADELVRVCRPGGGASVC